MLSAEALQAPQVSVPPCFGVLGMDTNSMMCLLYRFPQLLQSLPQQPASQLAPLVTCPPPGFLSQLAAVSVHIQELLLPGGDDLVLERPRIANYVATYKLPGAVMHG